MLRLVFRPQIIKRSLKNPIVVLMGTPTYLLTDGQPPIGVQLPQNNQRSALASLALRATIMIIIDRGGLPRYDS